LDSSLDPGSRHVQVAHNEYLIGAQLKPDVDSSRLANEIARYLRGDQAIATDRSQLWENLTPPLRERDYWALVLAKLTNHPLHIYVSDTDELRDRKIAALLDSAKTS